MAATQPGQHEHGRHWCGTMPVHHQMIATQPQYAIARAAIENVAFQRKTARVPRREAVVTIPVVVHVVHNDDEEDIPREQIDAQIAVLNQDYRRANPDAASVPEVWRDIAADARVEFHLATADPAGGATDGVVRVRTSHGPFGLDNAVKFAASGGSDAWPADRYLNVWVCRLEPWLGYAQFPGGAPETDGVVVGYTAFGVGGTATAPFDLGRTATHEVGHWLNLRHIWGDDDAACHGDDFVADTPNQGGPNFGAPRFPTVSCGNGPHGDQFMNYMDYTDDRAMYMFTRGQAERMDACLAGPRSSFVPGAVLGGMWEGLAEPVRS